MPFFILHSELGPDIGYFWKLRVVEKFVYLLLMTFLTNEIQALQH